MKGCVYGIQVLSLVHEYSKRHNKCLFSVLAETIDRSFCKAENEIPNIVNYGIKSGKCFT